MPGLVSCAPRLLRSAIRGIVPPLGGNRTASDPGIPGSNTAPARTGVVNGRAGSSAAATAIFGPICWAAIEVSRGSNTIDFSSGDAGALLAGTNAVTSEPVPPAAANASLALPPSITVASAARTGLLGPTEGKPTAARSLSATGVRSGFRSGTAGVAGPARHEKPNAAATSTTPRSRVPRDRTSEGGTGGRFISSGRPIVLRACSGAYPPKWWSCRHGTGPWSSITVRPDPRPALQGSRLVGCAPRALLTPSRTCSFKPLWLGQSVVMGPPDSDNPANRRFSYARVGTGVAPRWRRGARGKGPKPPAPSLI